MKYDFARRLGGASHHKRYRVFDAKGRWIPYVKECDTDTGKVIQYKRNDNGLFVQMENGATETTTSYYAAPLVVECIKPGVGYKPDGVLEAEPLGARAGAATE